MKEQSSTITTSERPVLASGAHSRWYILATVSLAFFFVAVTLWQRPPKGHTARIVITQTGHHGELDDKDGIVQAIIQTHEELAHHTEHYHGHSHDDVDEKQGIQEENVQPHLLVDVATVGSEKKISIWCACAEAPAAKGEAKMLAEAYVARVSLPVAATGNNDKKVQAEQKVARAQRELESAQRQLESFEEEFAAEIENANSQDSRPASPPKRPAPTVVAESNPRWVELNQRLAVLRAAREELLKDKTPAHPQVRDLQWQVEKVEAELAVEPRTIVSEAPEEAVVADEPAKASLTADQLRLYKNLQAATKAARQSVGEAEKELDALKTTEQSVSTAVASIDGPAKIVSSQGAGASLSGVVGGALFALVLGGLVAARSQLVREPSTLVSLQRVAALGVPIAATLTTGDGPALSPPEAINPKWIAWLTFTCELLIAAVALLLLLCALADWQFAAHLVRNPIDALTMAANRLW